MAKQIFGIKTYMKTLILGATPHKQRIFLNISREICIHCISLNTLIQSIMRIIM